MIKGFKPNDIKNYTMEELEVLCDDIRGVVYDTVMQNGGHLASNLGSVEVSVAICRVFDFPNDKIVFDVGHQCYPYKLLTGRWEKFSTLRQRKGISGFPKRTESEYDCYDTGHAGTSLSAAIGLAKARDLKGEDRVVIAFIGDGSFQNGLVYEALNSLKILNTNILIILNYKGMSIYPTVGGMHEILNEITEGNKEENIRLLEGFSLQYIGVKNGNNLQEMIDSLEEAKEKLKNGSVLLHILTKKGKGYEFSEDNPLITHGVSPANGRVDTEYSKVLGKTLLDVAKSNEKIVVITAAMTGSLGLDGFFSAYPNRSFDVGICEENACVLASAMATQGLKPYYAIYSTFLQRSFDEIIHDVCAQDLPVVFCVDRAGISGADGETHQGVFDLSYLSMIPNMTIAVPKDTAEFEAMIRFSEGYQHPIAIRYPRCGNGLISETVEPIQVGAWEYLSKNNGAKATIIGAGERVLRLAQQIKEELCKEGIVVDVVNARFVKPMDEALLDEIKTPHVITLEDNVKRGGLGEQVQLYLSQRKDITTKIFAYRDAFIEHGAVAELQRDYGVDFDEIYRYVKGL